MKNQPSEEAILSQIAADENTPPEKLSELARMSIELGRIVAANPCTPSELLLELSKSSDAIVCQNVTANPNTPTDILLNLGRDFPEELLNNSIFPLLLLEKPNLFKEIPKHTLRSILKYEEVPDSFLEWAGNRSDVGVLLAVAANPKTPKAVLEKLERRGHEREEVIQALRLHVNLAGEMAESGDKAVWQAIASFSIQYEDEDYLPHLARMNLIPDAIFQTWLKAKDNLGFIKAIAIYPRYFSILLKHLGKDCPACIHDFLAQNENTPPTFLKLFAEDADKKFRALAARHPNATLKMLEKLAEDESADVRFAVAENPNTPLQILEILAKDRYYMMSRAVAQNPSTPVKILEKLAKDKNADIRAKVAQNRKTPERILVQLARDKEGAVRQAVASNPHTPKQIIEQIFRENNEDLNLAISLNSNTPKRILEMLAENAAFQVRRHVAANLSTPVYILEKLARDGECYVRVNVACNPNTPANILELLAGDEEFDVGESIVKNPNNPASIFEEILQASSWRRDCTVYLKHHPEVLPAVLEHLAKHFVPSFSRFIVFSYPQTPATALAKNCRSLVWLERYAIASHANTPLDILRILTRDGNRVVRAAAKANLQNRQTEG